MAGPGGGPPRRSHTKSRKGCENCKKRHIRCDENFPQCRNCTKHKVRCPYNDASVPDERASTPDKPDLMWTDEIEAIIAEWQHTGAFPFPNLVYAAPDPQSFSVEELRLIYHVASICHELNTMDANGFILWTRQIPTIIAIGATHRFVLHALLAFSAEHIAFMTGCPQVGNMAYEHRGIALKGLLEGIQEFSRENSDAVLAASLVLSWMATEWRSWTQHMQGTSTVIDHMEPWKHESQFGDFIAESSTFPTAPPSPQPDRKPHQPAQEDLDAFERTISQLTKIEAHLKQNKEDPALIQQLAAFLKGARKVSPIQSIEDQFDRLRPLRTWLFWLPVGCLKENGATPSALLVIAHYYTAAMMMERLFPEIGAAYFGSLAIGPVEEIARRLLSINMSADCSFSTPLSLMEFSIDTITEFRARQGWHQPSRTQSFPQFDSPTFYMDELTHTPPPPSSSAYLPYGTSPAFSWSTEDLSLLAPDQDSGSAVSPMSLASPFHGSGQYLNIPSPQYNCYSPVSSSFGEGSISQSDYDYEDYGSFDTSMTGFPSACAAGPTNYSAGHDSSPSASSGYPPVQIPFLRHDTSDSLVTMRSTAFQAAPSPFLGPDQWMASCRNQSTTPLSVSVPSPVFLPSPHFQHHRQTSTASSAPSYLQIGDDED